MRLPKKGEFKAGYFARNPEEAKQKGKMLTELEKSRFTGVTEERRIWL